MGWFDKLKGALQKTKQLLFTDIRDLFKSEGRLVDEVFLEELLGKLVKTDMGLVTAKAIVEEIRTDYRARVVHMHEILAVVQKQLSEVMTQPAAPIQYADDGLTVVLVVGVNGSGKTTSIAKLVHYFQSQKKKVLLGAGDTYRTAAVEQLKIWAQRLNCPIVTGRSGGDPASVAHKAVSEALETHADVCVIDTAGRQQTQANLMNELAKIHRVISKLRPGAPHETLLVLDGTTGQSGLSQAQGFSDAAHCTGIFLAKLDGTARGGVAVAIRKQFSLPVKFVGVGEKAEDYVLFDSNQFATSLFDETRG